MLLGKKEAWDLQAFAIVYSHPRLLIVRAKLRQQPVLLVSGHARTTTASEQEVQEWWDLLDDALRRAPRGCVPLIGVDANAHWSANVSGLRCAVMRPVDLFCATMFPNRRWTFCRVAPDKQPPNSRPSSKIQNSRSKLRSKISVKTSAPRSLPLTVSLDP